MTEEEIRRLSNVDLLEHFHAAWDASGMGGSTDAHYEACRSEVLRRIDTGTGHIDRVPMHPDEYRR